MPVPAPSSVTPRKKKTVSTTNGIGVTIQLRSSMLADERDALAATMSQMAAYAAARCGTRPPKFSTPPLG